VLKRCKSKVILFKAGIISFYFSDLGKTSQKMYVFFPEIIATINLGKESTEVL
jgi:hypothetical protein